MRDETPDVAAGQSAAAQRLQWIAAGARLVDLTLPWSPECTPVPGHPPIQIEPLHTHTADGLSNSIARFSLHTATHIDAPYHFHADGLTIDRVPLDRLIAPATLVDLRSLARPGEAIRTAELWAAGVSADEDLSGRVVVCFTGWAADMWNTPDFYRGNPYLDEAAAGWLARREIAALGLDFSVDRGAPYPNHQLLLGRGIPLIENLINLDRIGRREFVIAALPLPVAGGNGGPARVVALVE
ncbi:MAG: cyclase family protein [Anaerolineae bacterium]